MSLAYRGVLQVQTATCGGPLVTVGVAEWHTDVVVGENVGQQCV